MGKLYVSLKMFFSFKNAGFVTLHRRHDTPTGQNSHVGGYPTHLCVKSESMNTKCVQAKCTNKRLYLCGHCSRAFTKKETRDRHLSVHTSNRSYLCNCGTGFKDRSNFQRHLRTHKGEKPFRCQLCPMAFARKEHLTVHILAHKGEKPLQCHLCPAKFRRKWRLKCHVAKQHLRKTTAP